MVRQLINIYHYLQKHKTLRWGLLAGLIAVFSLLCSRITLQEDISGFLPQTEQSRDVKFVLDNLKASDKTIVRFSARDTLAAPDTEMSGQAAEHFAFILDSLAGEYITSVFYCVDEQQMLYTSQFITANIPYFLDKEDYSRFDTMLSPEAIRRTMIRNKELLSSPMGMALRGNIAADPLHLSSHAMQKLQNLKPDGGYTLRDGYLFTNEGREQVFIITPLYNASQTALNEPFVEGLKKAVEITSAQFPALKISYFSAADVALTNARQIKRDSMLSISISMILIMLLLWYAFGNLRSIVALMLPVLFGALFAIAFIYIIQGSVSAIAIGAGSIIFGIAINYSIHFVYHSRHASSPEQVISEIASPMTIGSLSTVGAFLSLLFISADSMRDFGLFAALTLTGAIVYVLIFLPHFRFGRNRIREHLPLLDAISSYRVEKVRYLGLSIVAITVVLAFFSSRTTFDGDMHKINYMTAEQRENFSAITSKGDENIQSLYLTAQGNDMEKALIHNESAQPVLQTLLREGKIASLSGANDFLVSQQLQGERLKLWNDFWRERKDVVISAIRSQSKELGFREGAFDGFIALLESTPEIQTADYFAQVGFTHDFVIETPQRAAVLTMINVPSEHLDTVREQIANCPGTTLFDMGSLNRGIIEALNHDFNFVLWICGLIVFALLWGSFSRLEITLTAFAPMALSWIWILGIMGIFDIDFNIVNIILASFIFGLGDDFSIFITDGLMHEYAYGSSMTDSHKGAVTLSSLTMLFGIGTLVVAKHPAMLSLAQVTIIGMCSVVCMTYAVPPLIFNYLVYKRGKPRLIPITIENASKSLYAFLVFLVGSVMLTVSGFILLTLGGRSAKNKLRYHHVLCWTAKYVVRNMPMVGHRVLNPHGETFDRPAVIIANHQSHIDLMYMMMLSPKLIILTNEWVWRSPFYGQIIRYADYLPVAGGIENSVDRLRKMVEQGYSVVVFPEGTRSADGSIGRFHQGAFYLAGELGIDILPVVTHGIGFALPKTELLLRHSSVTVSILPRVRGVNGDYAAQARNMRKVMREEYGQMTKSYETTDYFGSLVYHNYIYKGASIERRAKRELRLNDNYRSAIDSMPHSGSVLITDCGIGVLPLMAALVRKDVQFTATGQDAQALLLAAKCASCPPNLQYTQHVDPDKFDHIIDAGDGKR